MFKGKRWGLILWIACLASLILFLWAFLWNNVFVKTVGVENESIEEIVIEPVEKNPEETIIESVSSQVKESIIENEPVNNFDDIEEVEKVNVQVKEEFEEVSEVIENKTVEVKESVAKNLSSEVDEPQETEKNLEKTEIENEEVSVNIEDVKSTEPIDSTDAEVVEENIESDIAVENEDIFADFSIYALSAGYSEEQIAWLQSHIEEVKNMPEEYKKDAKYIAQMLVGECGDWMNSYECSLAAWTAYNRLDMEAFHQKTILGVVSAPNQFHGYSPNHGVGKNCYYVALTVTYFYHLEKDTGNSIGRTLPSQYVYFWGDGKHNHFKDRDGNKFELWSTLNPYDYLPTVNEFNI